MRREGYELQVSPPHVLTKVIDGKTYEPMEHVVIDVPTQYQGAVMTGLGQRKAILQQMESLGTDACVWSSVCPAAACSATATSS